MKYKTNTRKQKILILFGPNNKKHK